MMMPWLGVVLFGDRFATLNVDQAARIESIILKETLANKALMKSLEDKTRNLIGGNTTK